MLSSEHYDFFKGLRKERGQWKSKEGSHSVLSDTNGWKDTINKELTGETIFLNSFSEFQAFYEILRKLLSLMFFYFELLGENISMLISAIILCSLCILCLKCWRIQRLFNIQGIACKIFLHHVHSLLYLRNNHLSFLFLIYTSVSLQVDQKTLSTSAIIMSV